MRLKITGNQERVFESTDVPDPYQMCYCGICSLRVGWYNESTHEEPDTYCDGCMADLADKQDD